MIVGFHKDGIGQIPVNITALLLIVPVPVSHLSRREGRESPCGNPSANTVKRALGRIFLVIDPSRFRPQFLPTQFIETTDKVIPQVPRGGLVSVAQLFNPESDRVIVRHDFLDLWLSSILYWMSE
jgi:hypothetical protein